MQKLKKDSSYSLLTLLFVTIFFPSHRACPLYVAKITFFSSPSKFCNEKMKNLARNNPSVFGHGHNCDHVTILFLEEAIQIYKCLIFN